MKNTFLVYDNHIMPNPFIKSIIGEKSFGEVILKRHSIRDKFYSELSGLDYMIGTVILDHDYELEHITHCIRLLPDETALIHVFSQAIIRNPQEAKLIFEKSRLIQAPLLITVEQFPVAFMMPSPGEYLHFLEDYFPRFYDPDLYRNGNVRFDRLDTEAFLNVSIFSNFQKYISGGFDTRFFNSVDGDDYTVTKTSANKKKIHAEYSFYSLLPEDMKMWFVMPYQYCEKEQTASYCMERYHMTDMAIRWVHGAVNLDEFEQFLERIFYFISHRCSKRVGLLEYHKNAERLYLDKVDKRVALLKQNPQYKGLDQLVRGGTCYNTIDDLVNRYKALYQKVSSKTVVAPISAISHGDLCFSNILYHNGTNQLKFIDPKGAENESQLWMDSYYDIAKLSHSVCGRYDFFNNALYQIVLGEDLKFHVEIDFDNSRYIALFRKFCEANGFDYVLVRLYEASLFLSMLPLHIDNPHKVFGFLLNAINVLNEVELCIKG